MGFESYFDEDTNEKEMRKNPNLSLKELEKLKKIKTEALTMEHMFFPLGLWLSGLLLSALFLLAEITIHRIRKSKTDVSLVSEVRDKARITFQERSSRN